MPAPHGRLGLRITATNDAVGVMPVRSRQSFSDATALILKTHNRLDHQPLVEFSLGMDFPKSILNGLLLRPGADSLTRVPGCGPC